MSLLSRTIIYMFKLAKISQRIDYKKPKRNTQELAASKINKKLKTNEWHIEGHQVITISPAENSNQHIIFLHGGAYVIEGQDVHRKLIERLVLEHHFKISYIEYPLAPEKNVIDTHRVVLQAYKEITQKNPNDKFYLFGDSAGGGLAVALLQVFREKDITPFPIHTAVVSPWLDVTMSNQQISEFEAKEAILSVKELQAAGAKYAGNLDPKTPIVSPMFGSTENLGSILMFVGTHEVFFPDCVAFAEQLKNSTGTHAELIIGEELFHDWIVVPIPESIKTINTIVNFFKS
jgi:epsilon-lactone hydrolase